MIFETLAEPLGEAGEAADAAWSRPRAEVRRALKGCFALVADGAAGTAGRASRVRTSVTRRKEADMAASRVDYYRIAIQEDGLAASAERGT